MEQNVPQGRGDARHGVGALIRSRGRGVRQRTTEGVLDILPRGETQRHHSGVQRAQIPAGNAHAPDCICAARVGRRCHDRGRPAGREVGPIDILDRLRKSHPPDQRTGIRKLAFRRVAFNRHDRRRIEIGFDAERVGRQVGIGGIVKIGVCRQFDGHGAAGRGNHIETRRRPGAREIFHHSIGDIQIIRTESDDQVRKTVLRGETNRNAERPADR